MVNKHVNKKIYNVGGLYIQRPPKNLPIDKLFSNKFHGGQGCQFVM